MSWTASPWLPILNRKVSVQDEAILSANTPIHARLIKPFISPFTAGNGSSKAVLLDNKTSEHDQEFPLVKGVNGTESSGG